jgi:hypothetical protein
MKKIANKFQLIFIILGLTECTSNITHEFNANCEEGKSIEYISKRYLGEKISNFSNQFSFFKVVNGYEYDDGLAWPVVFCYDSAKNLCLKVESSWEDTTNIRRIIISSNIFCSKRFDNVKVGNTFGSIKSFIDEKKINFFPDGYLGVFIKSENYIVCILDISEHLELGEGISSLDSIPNELKIVEIYLQ